MRKLALFLVTYIQWRVTEFVCDTRETLIGRAPFRFFQNFVLEIIFISILKKPDYEPLDNGLLRSPGRICEKS